MSERQRNDGPERALDGVIDRVAGSMTAGGPQARLRDTVVARIRRGHPIRMTASGWPAPRPRFLWRPAAAIAFTTMAGALVAFSWISFSSRSDVPQAGPTAVQHGDRPVETAPGAPDQPEMRRYATPGEQTEEEHLAVAAVRRPPPTPRVPAELGEVAVSGGRHTSAAAPPAPRIAETYGAMLEPALPPLENVEWLQVDAATIEEIELPLLALAPLVVESLPVETLLDEGGGGMP